MNDAIETILTEKVKACFSSRRLPDSFTDDLIASRKRRVRNFRLKICGIICVLTIVLGWVAIPSKHTGDVRADDEEQLISASVPKPPQEITGFMILGILRDCIFNRRNSKKREESSSDN